MMHLVLESMGLIPNKYFGSKWKNGDVIGFAFDTKAKLFSVSVNGDYSSPNG